ncbi:uncharacterized protein N7511_009009 [Penicillium nucicola]|uniref:uncharacterized protein n=1 Tax=Penicillium nucicola TaxID=1850975 RepID=UPI002545577A|nr:uncharacterized protein N7511_009009 [Penicillium nucicola]KAJ5747313.1 hypothetical protein N7511_009009 [Penicillium nucicola]
MDQKSLPSLSNEVWYLIFRQLLTQDDIFNVCAVSRSFRTLGLPVLYRSVILRELRGSESVICDTSSDSGHQDAAPLGLYSHLMDQRKTHVRAWVRDLTLEPPKKNQDPTEKLKRLDDFIRLLKLMPNIQNIYLKQAMPLTDTFLEAVGHHSNSPKLHLLSEAGYTRVDCQVSSVQALKIGIHLDFARRGESPKTIAPRELFLAFPNLRNLSISVQRRYGGCMPGPRTPLLIVPLKLLQHERFPPLESLSLGGYYVHVDEILSWRTKLPWQSLRSLHLTENRGFLEAINGSPLLLEELSIFGTEAAANGECLELNQILLSFDTLQKLEVTGHLPRMTAVAHHHSLKYLRLHKIEEPDKERKNHSGEDIQLLGQECGELQSLEIDVSWDNGWPEDVISALAKGFTNLSSISIHVASGLLHLKGQPRTKPGSSQWRPPLDEVTAASVYESFRHQRDLASHLKKVTLKTGEDKRWFPQWKPDYATLEDKLSRLFEIRFSGEEGDEFGVRELESNYTKKWRELTERIASRQRESFLFNVKHT